MCIIRTCIKGRVSYWIETPILIEFINKRYLRNSVSDWKITPKTSKKLFIRKEPSEWRDDYGWYILF